MFARRIVVRSFRKFRDLADDLRNAEFRTWEEYLRHLIHHCRSDSVMQVVTEPLRTHPNVDFKKWCDEFWCSNEGGGLGTYHYSLPLNDEERVSLLYQFLVAITEGNFDSFSFCVTAYGSEGLDDAVRSLNSEIVEKFTREVGYRLEEVEIDLGDSQEVDSSALMVFHYHGPVQTINGGVHGGIVALNSTVTDNKITYNDASQLARAVEDLGEHLDDVLEDHQASVSGAFALLVKAIETNTVPKLVEVATAVEAIGEGSPTGLQRLRGIIDNAAGSLLGEALKPLIASLLGAEIGG
jgi:hypothetical protein